MTDHNLHESMIALVLSCNELIRQSPSSRPTLKGLAPAGNLNYIFTGKTVKTGKNFLESYLLHQKLFKTGTTGLIPLVTSPII